jgi:SAM-dependent methyltransferase
VSVQGSWHDSARAWVRWARDPAADHTFWEWNLPAFLELLPEPGRLTVDLGCGEGRVARELIARGHRVAGVEPSGELAQAAREAEPAFEVHVAPADAVPLDDGCADLVVASMSLLNIEPLTGAVAEVARVLEPGGRFAFSIPHPTNSAKPLGDDPEAGSYFAEYSYVERRERSEGGAFDFHDIHRPLQAYVVALRDAGFLIADLREPRPPAEYVARRPEMERWLRRPCFLHVLAVRQ